MAESPLRRADFPITRRYVYLNHAGIAPLPRPVVDAMHQRAVAAAEHGGLGWDAHQEVIERARGSAARLMGVPVADLAFVKNTTEGLGFVANGLDWSPGDRVVVPDLDFPSTLFPFLALADRGVRVDRVTPTGPAGALPVEAYAERIAAGPAPKLVVASWVQFRQGWRTDLAALAALCRDTDALLCVDAIQGLGVLPARLEAWGVDVAVAGGHKWLLGPEGAGLLYVRGSRLEQLRPLEPGWRSVADREDWDSLDLVYEPTARRLEGGTPNTTGIAGLGTALDLLLDAGVDEVWRHVDRLCQRACESLTDVGATVVSDRSPGGRSGIVAFTVAGMPASRLLDVLRRRGIACAARGGVLRISPHGYNTEQEVNVFVDTVRQAVLSDPRVRV
ncbi:MAG: aminotransferase class V-fold PLP-dependent enzyme [Micromonosporaceae bacterium]